MAETVKQAESKTPPSPPKKIVKSPKFPALTLTDALAKAKIIYGQEKRNPTTMDVMIGHLGIKPKTGGANRTFAALRAYGLVDRMPGGNYAISERAWKLIVVLPEDSPERAQLMAAAAMSPALFKELRALYPGELPSDATLRQYLLVNKGFNENSVGLFLSVFKAALAIAKSGGSDYTPDDSEDESEDDQEDTQVQQQVSDKIQQPNKLPGDQYHFKALPGASMEFTLYLSQTKRGVLSVPVAMTAKEWKLLKKQIESSLDVAEATALVEESSEPSEPTDG